jgi:hypothetical protein
MTDDGGVLFLDGRRAKVKRTIERHRPDAGARPARTST